MGMGMGMGTEMGMGTVGGERRGTLRCRWELGKVLLLSRGGGGINNK